MRTRGICPVTGCCAFFASDEDPGTLLLPRLDIAPHAVVLDFRDLEMPGETETKRGEERYTPEGRLPIFHQSHLL
jgi:hypothetical protein